jgi:hypothetical protein
MIHIGQISANMSSPAVQVAVVVAGCLVLYVAFKIGFVILKIVLVWWVSRCWAAQAGGSFRGCITDLLAVSSGSMPRGSHFDNLPSCREAVKKAEF